MQVQTGAHDVGRKLHVVDHDLILRSQTDIQVFDLAAEIVVEGVFDAATGGPAEPGLRITGGDGGRNDQSR